MKKIEIKTIVDFIKDFDNDPSMISELQTKFDKNVKKDGFNLTDELDSYDDKKDIFDQKIINEIVLWKVNRYVTVKESKWLEDFNELRNLTDDQLYDNTEDYTYNVKKKDKITEILTEMCLTNGIRLPMATTMLRFRNPNVFQIIDVRTFHIMYGNNENKKKKLDANNKESIDIYFDYLAKLKKEKKINFWSADRILHQYDIDVNKEYYKQSREYKKNIQNQ